MAFPRPRRTTTKSCSIDHAVAAAVEIVVVVVCVDVAAVEAVHMRNCD